jgi:ribosomal protein L36
MELHDMKIIALAAVAVLSAVGPGSGSAAEAQAVSRTAPAQSIENRQARGQPDAVAKKRGTRCRIVKQNGRTRQVCSKAAVRR